MRLITRRYWGDWVIGGLQILALIPIIPFRQLPSTVSLIFLAMVLVSTAFLTPLILSWRLGLWLWLGFYVFILVFTALEHLPVLPSTVPFSSASIVFAA